MSGLAVSLPQFVLVNQSISQISEPMENKKVTDPTSNQWTSFAWHDLHNYNGASTWEAGEDWRLSPTLVFAQGLPG